MDQGLELLTEPQARQLLAGGEVGRVGITIGVDLHLPHERLDLVRHLGENAMVPLLVQDVVLEVVRRSAT